MVFFYKKSLLLKTTLFCQYITYTDSNQQKTSYKMKKKKSHLHTTFLKYLLEKSQSQELPEEETNLPDNKLSDEFDRIVNGDEVQDEVQDEIENDEENIDDLIEEYRLLEKIYKSKTNGNIYNKRK